MDERTDGGIVEGSATATHKMYFTYLYICIPRLCIVVGDYFEEFAFLRICVPDDHNHSCTQGFTGHPQASAINLKLHHPIFSRTVISTKQHIVPSNSQLHTDNNTHDHEQ
ncbi:hypothetical protein K523DRAFT_103640 [Schizophyllum commune Tattone D]|nr:hypothetical protein K523DRAFT_103640 [Schizophyllum commune Tattone D]